MIQELYPENDLKITDRLLDTPRSFSVIPVGRIMDKLDFYLNQNDYTAAEQHLRYWLSEAELCRDIYGKLAVLNEQIGLYRKTENKAECFSAIYSALSLALANNMERSTVYGTTLINAATGYKAFGKTENALPLYRQAQTIYESRLCSNDARLGGLYNNMAITLTELEEYREAKSLYYKAIDIMKKQKNGSLEAAITFLNLADLVAAESGLENGAKEIEKHLLEAEKLLNDKELLRDGYYAFVCKKCAPVFGYYGFFFTERELNERARDIYERS